MTNYKMVDEFHYKFKLPRGPSRDPLPSDTRALLRIRLMTDEMAELIEAMQLGDYKGIAKELADVLYTVYGTAVEYGVPMGPVFAEVHRSNMTKSPALDPGGKLLKGDDYEEADLEDILKGGA